MPVTFRFFADCSRGHICSPMQGHANAKTEPADHAQDAYKGVMAHGFVAPRIEPAIRLP